MTLDVPCRSGVVATYTGPLTHLCPFVDEVDLGTVTITWTTAGSTLELHALRAWLDELADDTVSHEDITDTIRIVLAGVGGIGRVEVVTTWATAGGEVTVRAVSGQCVQPAGA